MINWKYLDAEVYPSFNEFQNVILNVSWICELVDNGNVVLMEGKTGLEVENIDPNNYVSFDSVSYETIDLWVKEKLGTENILEIENSLNERLTEILNPKIEKIFFNFENETVVTEPVINDTSNDTPPYTERELSALENGVGIGTT
jgi:hypothetical protein